MNWVFSPNDLVTLSRSRKNIRQVIKLSDLVPYSLTSFDKIISMAILLNSFSFVIQEETLFENVPDDK
ncbi:hypothetical protein [Coprobacter sp.]|uniref:hypothetical protein n=1 Tax=Coprobacter sp. TaxID=1941478 RepID=UPI003AB64384